MINNVTFAGVKDSAQKIAKDVVLQDKITGPIKKAENISKDVLEAYKLTHGENVPKTYTNEAFNEACKAYAGVREPHAVKAVEEEIAIDGKHIFG